MLFFVSTSQEETLNVKTSKTKKRDCEKNLGVKFDSKLRFDQHYTSV